jgi:uncharacterized protein
MQRITVTNATKAVTVGARIELADTPWSRLFGLLGRRRLGYGRGMLIQPSSGVHTFGMAFPIDVIALDKHRRVLRTWRHLAPFRMTTLSFVTHACLELPAGQIDRCNIETGDRLEIACNPVDHLTQWEPTNSSNQESLTAGLLASAKAESLIVIPGVVATLASRLHLSLRTASPVAVRLARSTRFVAASLALLMFARWCPAEFLWLLAGALTVRLAIIFSGWNW